MVGVLVRVKRRLTMIEVGVAAALLLELAVLRLIGLVVTIMVVTVLGITHAESTSLWVLLANIQAIEVLALSSTIIWLSLLLNLPMLRIVIASRLKWITIKYELSIDWLSFELRMATVAVK